MAKIALCIGINRYPDTGADLAGCVNDANDWSDVLKARGYEVRRLLDAEATRAGMIEAIAQTIGDARYGDRVVVTYSGHGSWIPDVDGDEPDGRDEVLCPSDVARGKYISDDELNKLINDRAYGVRVVTVLDSCHSGSATRFADAFRGEARVDDAPPAQPRFLPPSVFLSERQARRAAKAEGARLLAAVRPFGGVLLSGCRDNEYSYDAWFAGRPNGAFTYCALRALATLPDGATYRTWRDAVCRMLPSGDYPQSPQVTGSSSQLGWRVLA